MSEITLTCVDGCGGKNPRPLPYDMVAPDKCDHCGIDFRTRLTPTPPSDAVERVWCQLQARMQVNIKSAMVCLAQRSAEVGTHAPNWDELALEAARAAIASMPDTSRDMGEEVLNRVLTYVAMAFAGDIAAPQALDAIDDICTAALTQTKKD